jgi:CheY-like chemotaxis protein
MPEVLNPLSLTQKPTSQRPLLGTTVLVVEDSRFACEAMRLLCLRSGARIRRADSLRSARRHLAAYRPNVAIIDLGLPDGSGCDLIRELTGATPQVDAIFAMSGEPGGAERAAACGADGYFGKPVESLAYFQQTILEKLPKQLRPRGPRKIPDEIIVPDSHALQDDWAHAADLLAVAPNDPKTVSYVARFLGGLARISYDEPMANAAQSLEESCRNGAAVGSLVAKVAAMVHERIEGRAVV